MITIQPVPSALVPRDSDAANRLTAPNYDEFQSDREVWDLLQQRPESVLRVTMAHCHAPRFEDVLPDGGSTALQRAAEQMQALAGSDLVRPAKPTSCGCTRSSRRCDLNCGRSA